MWQSEEIKQTGMHEADKIARYGLMKQKLKKKSSQF